MRCAVGVTCLTPALIVGADEEGQALAEQLRAWATSGLYLVGFADDDRPVGSHVLEGYRVLGRLDDLERLAAEGQSGLFEIMTTGLEVEEFGYVPLISVSKTRIGGPGVRCLQVPHHVRQRR